METATETLRWRLGWIGTLEVAMFLLSCIVHYFAYKSRGSLPFPSELNVLFFLSWSGIAVILLFTSHALKENPEISPVRIMPVILIYGALIAYWALGTLPMLLNGKIPLVVRAAGPFPWLLLRGWFLWLLISGAIRMVRAEKAESDATAKPGASGSQKV